MAVRDPNAAQSLADDFGKLTLAADALAWAHEQLPKMLVAMDLPSLLKTVLAIAKEASNVDGGFVVVWKPHPNRATVSFAALIRTEPEQVAEHWLPKPNRVDDSVIGLATRSGRPVFTDDARADARFKPYLDESHTICSLAAIPLAGMGALCLYDTTETGRFSRGIRLRLSALAALTAGILTAYTETAPNEPIEPSTITGFVGSSPPIRELRAAINAFSSLECPILILGEPGTGKAAAANAIHEQSARKAAPFIRFACNEHAPDRVEAMLFGEQSSTSTTDGVISKVADGSIFLEHVDLLPDTAQRALLTLINERTYRRLGGRDRFRFRGRILSSSNSDEEMPSTLRSDLFFGLAGALVRTPSLAIRTEDIPAVARNLVTQNNTAQHLTLSVDAEALLRGMQWPNNLIDLEDRINHAVTVVMSRGGEQIQPADLLGLTEVQGEGLRIGTKAQPAQPVNLKEATEAFQRDLVDGAMRRADGNVSAAAKDLGVTRQWLHRLLNRWAQR